MKYDVVILAAAEQDLRDLKTYLLKNFGRETWDDSFSSIKSAINNLKSFPLSGSIPEALEQINLTQFRQAIAGKNRIIYELRRTTIYVHLVADTRRDMKSLLMRRLLRMEQ